MGTSLTFWLTKPLSSRDTLLAKVGNFIWPVLGILILPMTELTDDVLFADVWERAELSPRDRSLITVAALIANGNTEQLMGHLNLAKANGLSEAELAEVMIHLAFYAGWPRAVSAILVAKEAFKK